jgi:hypothetical protein
MMSLTPTGSEKNGEWLDSRITGVARPIRRAAPPVVLRARSCFAHHQISAPYMRSTPATSTTGGNLLIREAEHFRRGQRLLRGS